MMIGMSVLRRSVFHDSARTKSTILVGSAFSPKVPLSSAQLVSRTVSDERRGIVQYSVAKVRRSSLLLAAAVREVYPIFIAPSSVSGLSARLFSALRSKPLLRLGLCVPEK